MQIGCTRTRTDMQHYTHNTKIDLCSCTVIACNIYCTCVVILTFVLIQDGLDGTYFVKGIVNNVAHLRTFCEKGLGACAMHYRTLVDPPRLYVWWYEPSTPFAWFLTACCMRVTCKEMCQCPNATFID